jgi:hypothetical protein
MGLMDFIKRVGKKIGHGISVGAKYIGEHVVPVVHKIADVVHKAAPYAAMAASALGQPELAAPIASAGRIAGVVKGYTGG